MSKQKGKYELLKEQASLGKKQKIIRACLLLALCLMTSVGVFAIWTFIYNIELNIPPKIISIPEGWIKRANIYAENFNKTARNSNLTNYHSNKHRINNSSLNVKHIENEDILPSKFGNYIYSREQINTPFNMKLICYYQTPSVQDPERLDIKKIDPYLCTHINIGIIGVDNNTLLIDDNVRLAFNQTRVLKQQNKDLKLLLWVGGGGISGFSEMVVNHANRKKFIQSLKETLEKYRLDGLDLDWEFPSPYQKERMHFSQLLHEIRREYQREHRTYLLSVAVAAPTHMVDMSYDVGEINNYADYVNIMTYDYHFYSTQTPFTGLNAPLYARSDEKSIFSIFNINYTVNYWNSMGLDKNKIIIGLPTYGHSFRLVNPFNTKLGAPAEGFGSVGSEGFVTYSEVCWFRKYNFYVTTEYDVQSCSPYLYAGLEWISYDDENSLECKTQYIKKNGFGGAMIFSLNTDDFASHCDSQYLNGKAEQNATFPLLRKIHSVLFAKNNH